MFIMNIFVFMQHLPEDSLRGSQALFVANDIVNMCDVTKPETFKR